MKEEIIMSSLYTRENIFKGLITQHAHEKETVKTNCLFIYSMYLRVGYGGYNCISRNDPSDSTDVS